MMKNFLYLFFYQVITILLTVLLTKITGAPAEQTYCVVFLGVLAAEVADIRASK